MLALDFCHRKGKVSRNIKLANTLLALAPGQLPLVKLSDFGFSKDTMRHSAAQSQVGGKGGFRGNWGLGFRAGMVRV